MAVEAQPLTRFVPSERHLHTIHMLGFFTMLGSGLVLYVPDLSVTFSDRPVMKVLHLTAACLWLTGLTLVVVLGDRAALRRTRREIERFDDEDLLWLRRRPATSGRFNAGQKAHAVIQSALALLFVVSGVLLWLGERNTHLRLPGTLALHDAAMYLAVALVAGHVYLALSASNRPALTALVTGTVPADWAAAHHPRWTDADRPQPAATPSRAARILRAVLAGAVMVAGVAAAVLLAHDVLRG